MIYVNDGYDVHLLPEGHDRTLCGEEHNLIHTNGQVPVTCARCLTVARQAFSWVLLHFRDDVQSKATTIPVVPLGSVTPAGQVIVPAHDAHTENGPAECRKCQALRDFLDAARAAEERLTGAERRYHGIEE